MRTRKVLDGHFLRAGGAALSLVETWAWLGFCSGLEETALRQAPRFQQGLFSLIIKSTSSLPPSKSPMHSPSVELLGGTCHSREKAGRGWF